MAKAIEDLIWQFYKILKDANVPAIIVHYENGFIKEIKIGRSLFLTKYANPTGDDQHHWFGFTVDDVEYPKQYSEAILVIGNEKVERCYSIPYSIFTAYLKTGKPVHIPRQDYDSYKATIFPTRNYVMKVAYGEGNPFIIENYRIADIAMYFKKFDRKTNAG